MNIMGSMLQDKCYCCVCNLKTRTIVMGCLDAVYSLAIAITWIAIICSLEPALQDPLTPQDYNLVASRKILYETSTLLAIMFLSKFLLDIFFVYAVAKERTGIVRTYIIVWIIYFLLSLTMFFINFYDYNTYGIFVEFLCISFNVYAFFINYSFYKRLNSREEV